MLHLLVDSRVSEVNITLFGVNIKRIEVDLQELINNNWRVELCDDDQLCLFRL